jgi:hypothetical protein
LRAKAVGIRKFDTFLSDLIRGIRAVSRIRQVPPLIRSYQSLLASYQSHKRI